MADTKSLARNVIRRCPGPLTQTLGFLKTALFPELSEEPDPSPTQECVMKWTEWVDAEHLSSKSRREKRYPVY